MNGKYNNLVKRVTSGVRFFSFLLVIAPVFFILGCTAGSWQSTLASGLILFTLSTFGAGCRKLLQSEDLTQLLLRYFLASPRGACHTPQDFTGGFDLSTDLSATEDGFRIDGGYPNNTGEQAGFSVHYAGDVNGDGFDDLIIGAPANNEFYATGNNQGVAYVVFGGDTTGNLDLTTGNFSADSGFKIYYGLYTTNMHFGSVVRPAGDINGDGIDDVIVGALYNFGEAFIVFGKSGNFADIDVNKMTLTEGFKISTSGTSTTGLGSFNTTDGIGDFNGDGFDDLIVATPNVYQGATRGTAIVIYGKSSGSSFSNIDIYTFASGSQGIKIQGPSGSYEGGRLAGAGDFNGDGFQDVVIGTPASSSNVGGAFIVFGQSGTPATSITLAAINSGDNTHGIAINGASIVNYFGQSVAPAGDVNGDGFDDVIIGYGSGKDKALIVYGSNAPANINISSLATGQGFAVTHNPTGSTAELGTRESVHGLVDINADGITDLIFGSPGISSNTSPIRYEIGEVTVLFGDEIGMADTELYDLPSTDGFSLKFNNPTSAYYYLGGSVSPAGDVNGDGCDDIIVGALGVPRDGYNLAGSAWVIFGGVQP